MKIAMSSSSTASYVLTISIILTSLLILSLSICEFVLEQDVANAFPDILVQIPGTSIAEWSFISMTPKNIVKGPTVAIVVAGTFGTVASVLAMVWLVGLWSRSVKDTIKSICGLAICIVFAASCIATLAIMTYIFVT
ncbi:hypothetical protein K469DRAFT_776808, partial [Zopfia rhizophila CBS 207.26]